MACPDEITDCDFLKSLGTEQILKKLLRKDGDCLSLNVKTNPGTTNSALEDTLIEADDNTALQIAIAAWRSSNPTFKQISIIQANSITKQAVIITHTT